MADSSSTNVVLGTTNVRVVSGNIDIGTVTSVVNVALDGTGSSPDTVGVVGSNGNRQFVADDGSAQVAISPLQLDKIDSNQRAILQELRAIKAILLAGLGVKDDPSYHPND